MWWETLARLATEALFPRQCGLCGLAGRPDVCPECLSECLHVTEGSRFFVGPYDWTDAAFVFEGRPSQAVRRLKYDRATCLVPWMASVLRARFDDQGAAALFDVVVPVPLARRRRAD